MGRDPWQLRRPIYSKGFLKECLVPRLAEKPGIKDEPTEKAVHAALGTSVSTVRECTT